MGHGPCTFKQRDVTAAVKAARAGGMEVARVEIGKDGRIVIVAGKPVEGTKLQPTNEWDSAFDGNDKVQTR